MIKPKPYLSYRDSGDAWLGQVPSHWSVLRGSAFLYEKKRKNENLQSENYLSLMAGRGVIPYAEKGDVGNKKPDDLTKCKIVEAGDFVVNSMNFSIGSYGISKHHGICSPVYVVMSHNDEVAKREFVDLILSNPSYQNYAQSFGTGILDHRRSIGWDEIKRIPVAVPPIEEQIKIANYAHQETTRIDTLIAKKTRFIELLKEKRQAVITKAVTKGLDDSVEMKDSGLFWLRSVPSHWSVAALKNLISIKNGADYKHIESNDGYPVIGSGGPFAFCSEAMYEGETVLLGRKGTIDKPLYWNGSFWAVDTMYWSVISENSNARFVYYVATTIPFGMYSTNTALPSMTKSTLGSHLIAYPNKEEQNRIADFLDNETSRIDSLVRKTERSIELLKEKRSALITAAVTGKIDVREAA